MSPVRKLGTLYDERSEAAAHRGHKGHEHPLQDFFSRFATRAATAAGSFWAFIIAFAVIVLWLVTGPMFGWSDTWQLVINTATTIVTFLMVFLIQHAQNRDTRILHIKLNELIAAMEGASNELIDLEEAEEGELKEVQQRMQRLAKEAVGGEARSVSEQREGLPPANRRSS
ncbi:MAG: low affinity iron permease family protein [Halobacteriales archaeon]|nr:low affinity iron permease family protein [Halobacteriales archaeon]